MTPNLFVFIIQLITLIFIAMFAPNMGYAGGYILIMVAYWGGYINGVRDVERNIGEVARVLTELAKRYKEEADRMEEEKIDGK